MAKVTAAQWMDKWARRLNAAQPDIQAGIDRVQVAPGALAAQAQDRYIAGVMEAAQDGTWANAVSKVSLQDWKNAAKTKGGQRMAAGITQAQATKMAKIQQSLQAVDAAVADISSMPRGGLEQNIARSAAFARAMAARAPKRNQ